MLGTVAASPYEEENKLTFTEVDLHLIHFERFIPREFAVLIVEMMNKLAQVETDSVEARELIKSLNLKLTTKRTKSKGNLSRNYKSATIEDEGPHLGIINLMLCVKELGLDFLMKQAHAKMREVVQEFMYDTFGALFAPTVENDFRYRGHSCSIRMNMLPQVAVQTAHEEEEGII